MNDASIDVARLASDDPTTETVLIAITTIGRPHALSRLLASLRDQLGPADQVIVAHRQDDEDTRAVVKAFSELSSARVKTVSSGRGSSIGRNTAAAAGDPANDPVVLFPNDTCEFPKGSISAIKTELAGRVAGGLELHSAGAARLEIPPPGTALDRRTAWRVIEPGLVMRLSRFRDLSGFDESLGSGSATPWQAGESADLLLRLLSLDPSAREDFRWIPPAVAIVSGVPEQHGLSARQARWKLRAYGRGIGRVYSAHGYPIRERLRMALGGLLIGVRRRHEYSLLDGWSAFLGRIEGLTGRTLDRRFTAVEK